MKIPKVLLSCIPCVNKNDPTDSVYLPVKSVKNVSFSDELTIHSYENVNAGVIKRASKEELDYRAYVDGEARKVGLSFAAGHHYYKGQNVRFDEGLAKAAMKYLSK